MAEAMINIEFAQSVTANQVVSSQLLCPTSGSVCAARENLVNLYSDTVALLHENFPPELRPELDSAKLRLKLAEMTVAAQVIGCSGIRDGECPTRASMTSSETRTKVVSGIRKIIHRGTK